MLGKTNVDRYILKVECVLPTIGDFLQFVMNSINVVLVHGVHQA